MARERQFVTGDNIDAKFVKINKILNRLTQRTTSVSSTLLMPKIPIVGGVQSVGADGVILRFLIPLDGYIRKAYMYVDNIAAKVKPQLTMTMYHEGGSQAETLIYAQGPNTMTREIPVTAGSRLVLSTTDPESVSGISVGLVFEVGVSATIKEQIALAAHLDRVEANNAREATEGEAA